MEDIMTDMSNKIQSLIHKTDIMKGKLLILGVKANDFSKRKTLDISQLKPPTPQVTQRQVPNVVVDLTTRTPSTMTTPLSMTKTSTMKTQLTSSTVTSTTSTVPSTTSTPQVLSSLGVVSQDVSSILTSTPTTTSATTPVTTSAPIVISPSDVTSPPGQLIPGSVVTPQIVVGTLPNPQIVTGSIRWGRVLKGSHQYFCDVCHAPFTKKNDLKTHQTNSCLNKGVKKFKCTYGNCTKEFAYEQSLKDHTNKGHTGLKPYKCEFCGTNFCTNNKEVNHHKSCSMKYFSPSLQNLNLDNFNFLQ